MQAESGLMHLTGEPDGPPSRLGAPSIIDQSTGLTAAVGLLSAIIQARSTGKGCDVDICLLEVALHQLGYRIACHGGTAHRTSGPRWPRHTTASPGSTNWCSLKERAAPPRSTSSIS
jgi:crotonobetainyl-CoA:carnitine CoA-transferase CaiB-like acyl-CoA transferase